MSTQKNKEQYKKQSLAGFYTSFDSLHGLNGMAAGRHSAKRATQCARRLDRGMSSLYT